MEPQDVDNELERLTAAFQQGFVMEAEYARRKHELMERRARATEISALQHEISAPSQASSRDKTGSSEAAEVAQQKLDPSSFREDYFDMSPYAYAVLKQVHPDTGISVKAMAIMNSMLNDVLERLATLADENPSDRTELTAEDVQAAVEKYLPGALRSHGIAEALKALTKYQDSARGGTSDVDLDNDGNLIEDNEGEELKRRREEIKGKILADEAGDE